MTKRVTIATALALCVSAAVVAAALWFVDWSHESAPVDGPGSVAATPVQTAPIVNREALAELQGDDVLARILLLPSDFQQTLTLYALLADADSEALERLLDEADHLQPRREGYAAKSIIYSRYAEVHPEAAIERILAAGTSEQNLLQQVFRAWAKYDLGAALQHAETMPPIHRRAAGAAVLSVGEALAPGQQNEIAAAFGLRRQLEQMRAEEAIRGRPADAWRQTLAAPASQQRDSKLLHIADRWAQQEPERAVAAVGELPPTDRRQFMLRHLMTRWTMADRDAARRYLEVQPPFETQTALNAGFAAGLAQSAPYEALDFALGLAAEDRLEAARAVIDVWADRDPAAAAEALAALGDSAFVEDGMTTNLMHKWASVDPHAALRWIAMHGADAQQDWWPNIPLAAIAEHNPEEALAAALALRGEAQASATVAVVSTWARNSPRAAAAWLQGTSRDIDPYVVSIVADAYAGVDLEETLDWLKSMPSEQRQAALYSLADEVESLAMASRIVASVDDPVTRNETVDLLAARWAYREPIEALRWVERTAKRDQLAALHGSIFGVWARMDFDAAAARAPKLRTQAQRDAAYSELVLASLYDEAPELAERLYKRIRGAQARQETARNLYFILLEQGSPRAERYREAAAISSPD